MEAHSHPHRPQQHQVVGSGPRQAWRPRYFPGTHFLSVNYRASVRRTGALVISRSPSGRPTERGGPISTELRINDRIRVPEVRLVGPNGETVGIVPTGEALKLAQEADLDLVEVAPMARPPVCKLMDYGKFKYENAQKAREARRNQTNVVIKEMKLRPKIDPHDYETKKGHVVRFLRAGDKVKITIMFRGREQHRPELGFRLLQRLAEDVTELGFVESSPKQDGRNMIMVLGPHKKKAEAKVEMAAEKQTGWPSGTPTRRRSARSAPPTTPGTPSRRRRRGVAPRTSTRRSKPERSKATAAPTHVDQPSSRPGRPTTSRRRADAEDEDPLGCEEALQGTGSGQAAPPAGRRKSGAAFASAPTPAAAKHKQKTGTVDVAPADVKGAKKLLGL